MYMENRKLESDWLGESEGDGLASELDPDSVRIVANLCVLRQHPSLGKKCGSGERVQSEHRGAPADAAASPSRAATPATARAESANASGGEATPHIYRTQYRNWEERGES